MGELLMIEGADHTFNIFSDDMSAIEATIEATTAFFVENLVA